MIWAKGGSVSLKRVVGSSFMSSAVGKHAAMFRTNVELLHGVQIIEKTNGTTTTCFRQIDRTRPSPSGEIKTRLIVNRDVGRWQPGDGYLLINNGRGSRSPLHSPVLSDRFGEWRSFGHIINDNQ